MTAPVTQTCTWTEDENGCFSTGCGRLFEFTEGDPRANRFAWCPYCGSRLIAHRFAHTNTPPGADEDE